MKRGTILLIGISTLFVVSMLWIPVGGAARAQDASGHWQLVDTEIKKASGQSDGCRKETTSMDKSYSLYEVTNECLEKSTKGWPCLWASMISWGQPPKEFSAWQKVTLKVNMGLVYNYSSEQPQDYVEVKLTGGDGKTLETILDKTAFHATSQEVESQEVRFTAPELKDLPKSAGSRIKIVFLTRAGQVSFVYDWIQGEAVEPGGEETIEAGGGEEVTENEDGMVEEDEATDGIIEVQPTDKSKETEPDPTAERKKCMDSGTRFIDLTGKVDVASGDNPDEEDYEHADGHMVLCVGDHIRTGIDSHAILGFSDMTTFVMEPETIIFLETPPQSDSKLRLVWGKIMVNIKKMLKDGSMEITMNQAVAGIKGTTLVAEQTGSESRIKVIEGTVEFTDTATGRTLEINRGETVAASEEGLGSVEEFDVAEEEKAWKEFDSGKKKLSDYCLPDKLLGLLVLAGLLLLRRII